MYVVSDNNKMPRPKKYNTTEERLEARRATQRKYVLKNLEKQREMSKLCMRKLRLKNK